MTRRTTPLLFVVFLASCASTHEAFTVSVLRPAPVDLSQHELLAFDRFRGASCEDFARELREALAGLRAPGRDASGFEVVDRGEVDRVIDDMRRYPGAGLDKDPNSALAKWKRARIVLSGSVDAASVSEDITGQAWTDKEGAQHTTFVRNAKASFEATLELQSQDGRVLDRAQLRESASGASKAVDTEPAPIDHTSLQIAARRKALETYLRRVAPHVDHVRVTLFTDSALPLLATGNGFARIGDWDAAHESYADAEARANGELDELRFKASYNRGIALLYLSRFDEAREALKSAYMQSNDRSILDQMTAVAEREAEYELLREQGAAAKPQN